MEDVKLIPDTGQVVCLSMVEGLVNIDEDNRHIFLNSLSFPMLREIAKYIGISEDNQSDDHVVLAILSVLEHRFLPVNFSIRGKISIKQDIDGIFYYDAIINGEEIGGKDDSKRRGYGLSRDDAFVQAKEDIKPLLVDFICNLQSNSKLEVHNLLEDPNNEQSSGEIERAKIEEVTGKIDRAKA